MGKVWCLDSRKGTIMVFPPIFLSSTSNRIHHRLWTQTPRISCQPWGSDGEEMQGGLLPVISRGPQLLFLQGFFTLRVTQFVWPFIGVITPTLHGNLTHTLELPPTQDASHHQDYANFIWSPNLNLHLWYHTQELNGTLPTDPDP